MAPILTRATWLELRDEFERRAANAVQPGAPWTHLLTSFLVCNECGETLTCTSAGSTLLHLLVP